MEVRRFLPDRAIDPTDEAAAKLKMEITSQPNLYYLPCCASCLLACRFLPDKAIYLMDEAAAKLNIEITSKPDSNRRCCALCFMLCFAGSCPTRPLT